MTRSKNPSRGVSCPPGVDRRAGGPPSPRFPSVRRSAAYGLASFTGCLAALLAAPPVFASPDVFDPPLQPPRYEVIRAEQPPTVDGRLDEALWRGLAPITDFVQREPEQGGSPSFRTEIRIAFDTEALYIGARCDQPRETLRIQNLRRDFEAEQNDALGFAIDGFLDQRNAVVFEVTPGGNQRDLEVLDGSTENVAWDVRWRARTTVDDDGWQAELAIPWRNLRYRPGTDELGLIVTRSIRHRNESLSFPPVPRAVSSYRMAYAARLTGLSVPASGRNVTFNPYLLYGAEDRRGSSRSSDVEAGGELKWAISPGTVLDLTANTDFAQAEVDRQVVNLDRFSVFFPERRQFFLENANLFNASVTRWIQPFFSRRIGLDDAGQPIPITGGLRLTSRTPQHEFAALAMHQEDLGDSPAATFAVARYAHNLGEQSRIGGMVTHRRDDNLSGVADASASSNTTLTVDGTWRPNQVFGVKGMVSYSRDDDLGEGLGGQLWLFYENSFLDAGLLEYYNRDYEPGVGLEILDTNYMMHSPALSFDLRPEKLPDFVRSFDPGFTAYVFQSSDTGDLLFGYAPIRPLSFQFENGGSVRLILEPNRQRLDAPFFPAGIEVAPGDYDYLRYRLSGATDSSTRLSFSGSVETGEYFDGDLTTWELGLRYAPGPSFEVAFDGEMNELRSLGVAQLDQDTRLYGLDFTYSWSPRLQLSAFAQRSSLSERTVWNARMAWEFGPLSYLYLVYTGDRSDASLDPHTPFARGGERVILKLSYLFDL